MATYEIKNATSTHNINNLDKTIFDRDYSKENNIPNDNKIVQYYNLKDIKHDISSQFIILKNTDREVCPELRVKLLDNLNYSRNMLDNLTMRQQAVMEEFLRVFTSMYKASAMSEAIMSNVFEQLVQYQRKETERATAASSIGVIIGSGVGAVGASASAVANYRSHPKKMVTLTPDQEHTIERTDDNAQRASKREVIEQQASLKQIDEKIKNTTKDTNLNEKEKEEALKSYDKEKEATLEKIRDTNEKISTKHNNRYNKYFTIGKADVLSQLSNESIRATSRYLESTTHAEKDIVEQAKNVMHSVMSSYLDQISRDVQGRDQALNLLQQIIQTIIDTDSAIVQGIRS
ncbi:TPA: hypothetical protein J6O92_004093 [Escherichia coli]|nr:hypothetical protein [Escherichia coli]HBA2701178.1 hypothetical protein [Escherichia coli]HBA2710601.1 hypothetical protein [Escherichia coli]